ncbi:MarR family winged helix-turn-helix transcriptional regulator [Pacificibacter marinus]|uniref:Transcriptional regulator SlyA n=1 Tax=Pacificibacter marinus TaxID=658057 RepID=A0A1Y5RJ55_9RHOB|nr:MarR family transcriptional regulator [Pacificibacter marinus]SEK18746.1 DNA-binding transcriptional regulator, MarR family [Pacificibacter marinus]SLN17647.1 Transcriptional regulator SlyA [Pacificibacter marinus]
MAHEMTDLNLRQFAGYNLKRVYLLVHADLMKSLEPLGLRTMTFSALNVVAENPNLTQSQLAQTLKIERSGVVVLVDELENTDLISRNRVEGDRRSYALHTTPEGAALLAKANQVVHAHEDKIFSDLSQNERDTLRGLLGRIDTPKTQT